MTTSVAVETTSVPVLQCPQCGRRGRRVSTVTLRALLKQEDAERILPAEYSCCDANGSCQPLNHDTGWRFCDSADCDVVYFAEQNGVAFTRSQLKVPVGVKEKSGERPLCYCFGHSVATIAEELRTKGRSEALEDIRRKMKDPGCHCETSNPSGTCCLGRVAKGIDIARKELGMAEVPKPVTHANQRFSGRGETISKMGVLASAIMASSCCWLPLVLLAVGISGAGIAATLELYRPLFIVVTFGFLAAAFYFTYRPKKAAAGGAHACSDTEAESSEDCRATASKGRFNMMTLNKAMLWVVTAFAVAFLLFPSYVGTLLGNSNPAAVTANMNQAVFKIEGMTCEGCAATVAQAIKGVPGVEAVSVTYKRKEAIVGTDACCPVPREEIVAALKKAGYVGRMGKHRSTDLAREKASVPRKRT